MHSYKLVFRNYNTFDWEPAGYKIASQIRSVIIKTFGNRFFY